MPVEIWVIVSIPAIALAAFLGYLFLCALIVLRTGHTGGLRDAAFAVRAFSVLATFGGARRRK
jgi:hypothetical protein